MSLNLIPDNITLRKMSKVNNAYWSEACWSCLKAGDKGRWWWFLFASLPSDRRGKGGKGSSVFFCKKILKKFAPSNLSGCFTQLRETQCLAGRFHTMRGMALGVSQRVWVTAPFASGRARMRVVYQQRDFCQASVKDLQLMTEETVMYFKIHYRCLQMEDSGMFCSIEITNAVLENKWRRQNNNKEEVKCLFSCFNTKNVRK